MSAPQLTRSLVLEAATRVSDGAGGYSSQWTPLGVLWAEIDAGAGRSLAAFAATVSRVPCKITVRASPYGAPSRPVAGQRFREGMRIYTINAVAARDPQARYLVCDALEEVAT